MLVGWQLAINVGHLVKSGITTPCGIWNLDIIFFGWLTSLQRFQLYLHIDICLNPSCTSIQCRPTSGKILLSAGSGWKWIFQFGSQNCGSFHGRLDRGITGFFWLEWGVSIISGRLHPDFIIWLIAVIAIFLQSSFPTVQGVQSSPHVFSPADGHRARQKLTFSSLWPLSASADRSRPQSCCRSTWKARSTLWTTSPVMAFTRPPWFGPFGCWNAGGSGTQVPKKNGSSCWTCEDWNSGHFISWSLKAQ